MALHEVPFASANGRDEIQALQKLWQRNLLPVTYRSTLYPVEL